MLLMSYMIYSHGSKENIGGLRKIRHKGPEGHDICSSLILFLDMNPPKLFSFILTETALFPVVAWQTVIALSSRGTVFTLAEPCAVTPVMNRTHLVAVTL